MNTSVVRAMMVTRANGMAKGGVGVRAELIQAFLDALNAGVHPVVRTGGSVGQADLAEMAEIGQVLIGRGEADYEGRRLPGAEALRAAGLQPVRLKAKEGLALISANGVTMGHGSLVLADVADLLDAFDVTAALSLEAYGANLSTIHPEATRMRPHPGQSRAADRLRELLEGSYLWRPGAARNLQDPLSFRCVPQTHGACYDAHAYSRGTMEVELNSASDNPLVLLDDQSIISVGNFDVVALAVAFDLLRVAVAQVVHLANERIQKHLWSQFSGLPTGLAAQRRRRGIAAPRLHLRLPRGRGAGARQPCFPGLPRPDRRRLRRPRKHGPSGSPQNRGTSLHRTPHGRARAHRRHPRHRPARQPAARSGNRDSLRHRPRVRHYRPGRALARRRRPDGDHRSGRLVARVASEIGPLEPVSTTGDAVGPAESRE